MDSDLKRYARQMRLVEVGREKQLNLRCASVRVVGDDLAAHVEALYLAGAGIGTIEVARAFVDDVTQLNPDVVVEVAEQMSERVRDARVASLDRSAGQVADGALAALSAMKRNFAS